MTNVTETKSQVPISVSEKLSTSPSSLNADNLCQPPTSTRSNNSGVSSDQRSSQSNTGVLHSEILQVQNKRYYFDIKEHDYGRFLKLAETGSGGGKSRMVIPVYLLPEIDRILTQTLEIYQELENENATDSLPVVYKLPLTAQMSVVDQASGDAGSQINRKQVVTEASAPVTVGPSASNISIQSNNSVNLQRNYVMLQRRGSRRQSDQLQMIASNSNISLPRAKPSAATEHHHEILESGKRRYYFNLKENNRGRYLRVKAIGDIPQTFPGNRRKVKPSDAVRAIILPAVGIERFRDMIRKLNSNHGVDKTTDKAAIVDAQITEKGRESDRLVPSKRFICKEFKKVLYIDSGTNSRGTFCRITEQQRSHRETVTIPSEFLPDFAAWLLEANEKLPEEEKARNLKFKEVRQEGAKAMKEAKVSVMVPSKA